MDDARLDRGETQIRRRLKMNPRDFMEAEATAEDIELRRRNFEHATWKRANKQKHNWPVLYDAGDLGFCLLDHCSAFGGHWVNRWFDKAEKL
jgi:hypothetical protein